MERWSNILVLVLLMLGSFGFSSAQSNRYIIYFVDKANSEYSIDQPNEFLSQRAIDRRDNQNIEITEEDLPVSPAYIDSLQENNYYPYFKSKWLNAVLVELTNTQAQDLEAKSYIQNVELVAPGDKLTIDKGEKEIDFNPETPTVSRYTSRDQLNMLGADELHEAGYTGEGLWIAIFDAGYEYANKSEVFSNTFENNKIKATYDFTNNNYDVFESVYSHGTSVMSCIVAHSDSLLGTAPDAQISLYITEDGTSEYRIEEYNWLFAAEEADSSGVDIISSSVGYYDFDDESMSYSYADLDGETSIVTRAAALASSKGILVVASAGNEGSNSWMHVTMPADAENVLAVGAVDILNQLANFSSIGPTSDDRQKPEIVAKGVRTTVLSGSNNISVNSGTSFSAPLISGFAASLWQQFPELTSLELRNLIIGSGDIVNEPNNKKGYGLPSYNRIIEGNDDSNDVLSVKEIMGDDFTVFPNPIKTNTLSIKVGRGYNGEKMVLSLFSPNGKLLSQSEFEKVKSSDILKVDMTNENKGIYLLNIQTKNESKSIKVLKY